LVTRAPGSARSVGIAATAAVVDEAGVPIVVERMDGAAPWTAELALSQAYPAAAFHLPPPRPRTHTPPAVGEEPPGRASGAPPTGGRRSRDLRRHHDHRRRGRRGRAHDRPGCTLLPGGFLSPGDCEALMPGVGAGIAPKPLSDNSSYYRKGGGRS